LETAVKKLYEAMFLVDSAQASDWDAVVKTIKTILGRAEAEIVSIRNWAERKLAYVINNKTRGTYILCYFKADGERIRNIEKAVQLSEQIMRVLILSVETREKEAVEENATLPDSQPHLREDKLAPAKAEAQTGEMESPQKEGKMETQEDILATPAEKEEQKAVQEAVEKVSTQKEAEQAGESEQSAEPAAVDASPVRNSLKSNNTNEKRKISNGASESEQLEQPETEKDS